MRKSSNTNNHQAKVQGKLDGRMNKHRQKSALRHEDDINRLNLERRRKIEMEQAGIVGVPARSQTPDNAKYMLLVVLCFGVIIFFCFRILQRKVEAEQTQDI